jgi:hypothetical protein
VLFASVAIALSACAHDPAVPSAGIGSPFRIGVGESVRVEGTDVVLGFDQVTEDSRCPADVVCVWAGTARLKAWVRGSGQARRDVELQTFPKSPLSVDGYSIEVEDSSRFPTDVRIVPQATWRRWW